MDDLLSHSHPDRKKCIELNRKRFDPSFLLSFSAIAVSAVYDWYKPEHLARFLEQARRVAPTTPIFIFGNFIVLNRECWEIAAEFGVAACTEPLFIEKKFLYEKELEEVASRNGATFLSMQKAFCLDGQCLLTLGDVPFAWDKFHFSYEFSVELGRRIEDKVRVAGRPYR